MLSPAATRLGVLGAGQLGRMLIPSALDLSLQLSFLDQEEAPCRSYCDHFVCGDFRDYETVCRFGRRCDLVTIEIEDVNCDALAQLADEGIVVHPAPHIIALVQDKLKQKQFLQSHHFPTANFRAISSKQQLEKERFPLVQKLRQGGYDGRGVLVLKSANELHRAFDAPSLCEPLLEIESEIALLVARNWNGERALYPPVSMCFHPEANLMELLLAPAQLSSSLRRQAEELVLDLAEALQICGVLAVEMFVLSGSRLFINELAPRPHNSAHYTIDAAHASQFEQHLRGILGLPLAPTQLISAAASMNLLGADGFFGKARYAGLEKILATPGAHLHLYGKQETKPFRKMGHITVLDKSVKKAEATIRQIGSMVRVFS